jgi:hypothetical protein
VIDVIHAPMPIPRVRRLPVWLLAAAAGAVGPQAPADWRDDPVAVRVERAALAMQRQSCEQGILAQSYLDADGLVQGVAGAPDFRHAGIAPEGQAFFLMMETAARGRRRSTP